MENLENQCLEKLNKILSRFKLKIDIIDFLTLKCEYRLVDNSSTKPECIGIWLSISEILVSRKSIFDYLTAYYYTVNNSSFSYIHFSASQLSKFQKYAKIYQFIQSLKSSCLEEFLIKYDLMDI